MGIRIYLSNASTFIIRGNYVHGNSGDNIYTNQRIIADGNIVNTAACKGFNLDTGASNSIITGNKVDGNGDNGVHVASGVTGVEVRDNMFTNVLGSMSRAVYEASGSSGPTYMAGNRILGMSTIPYAFQNLASIFRGELQTVVKPSDTTVSSNTTVASDPALTVILAARATYRFQMVLLMEGPSGGSADFKWAMTAPSGASGMMGQLGLQPGTGGDWSSATAAARTSLTSTAVIGTGGATTPTTAVISGEVATGSSSGTFALQWAQNTSNSTAVTLLQGSYLTIEQVA